MAYGFPSITAVCLLAVLPEGLSMPGVGPLTAVAPSTAVRLARFMKRTAFNLYVFVASNSCAFLDHTCNKTSERQQKEESIMSRVVLWHPYGIMAPLRILGLH